MKNIYVCLLFTKNRQQFMDVENQPNTSQILCKYCNSNKIIHNAKIRQPVLMKHLLLLLF